MMRGINRQRIFDDESDYDAFISILHHLTKRDAQAAGGQWSVYAYALMSNHFHMLVNCKELEVGVEDYPYTSWHEYLNNGKALCQVCRIDEALERVGIEELKEIVESPLAGVERCLEYSEGVRRRMTDAAIASHMSKAYGMGHPADLLKAPKGIRDQILRDLRSRGAGVRQLQRVTGVGYSTISRLK
ncbi:MAG: transposase [Bacteroidales bacterium]|nr:transposase [Bacteroidales bacterium]